MNGHYISTDDWPDFARLLRAFRAGELTRPRGGGDDGRAGFAPHRLVVLRENLDSGGSAKAEILGRAPQGLQVLDIDVAGWPEALQERTFTLQWQGEALPPIPLEATAEQLYELLKASGSPVRPYLVNVTLGAAEDLNLNPGRWRVELAPNPKAPQDPWPLPTLVEHSLGSNATVILSWLPYVGTGRTLTVHSVLPTGAPSPLRRGAQCAVAHLAGVGWGVIAAEARKYPEGSFAGVS